MQKYLFLLSFILLFINHNLKSQIIVNTQEACIGEVIEFTYNTSSNLTNIQWNFDDGGTGSNDLSSQHQYNNANIYNVTFSADDNGNTISENITITIHPNPTCAFTHSPAISGCVGLDVSFTDTSVGGGNTSITSWHWDFGDGGTSTEQNPTYIFSLTGQFDINLQIQDANNCVNNCSFNEISVTNPPIAIINTNPNPPSSCEPPLEVEFNAGNSQSTITSNPTLTYSWNIEGDQSNTEIANYIFSNFGNFNAYLTVTDAYGCSSQKVKYINVNTPIASFEVEDTVCISVYFNNTSTPADYIWAYGDGQIGSSNEHTYQSPGNYTVTLIASSQGCSDTVSHDIYVEEVIASFEMSPDTLCDLYPDGNIIHYINTSSSNAVLFTWDLVPDNDDEYMYSGIETSLIENTNDTISFNDTIYSYNKSSTFEVCLSVESSHSCTSTICKTLFIQKPNALFMPDIINGCAPLTVQFSDSSIAYDSIVEYSWNFDDGNILTGTDEVVSHTFSSPGSYNVVLSITTEAGCVDTSYAITINVGQHTNPDFDISVSGACPLDTIYFTDLTPESDSVDTWQFITGDNQTQPNCYNDFTDYMVLINQIGDIDISLITCNNGCCDTITKNAILQVSGPLCDITRCKFECANPYDYIFMSHIEQAENWQWDFGDGTVVSNLTNLSDAVYSHHYDVTGDYTVYLTAYNSSTTCDPFVDSITVHVRDIKAAIDYDSLVCQKGHGNNPIFNAANSIDVNYAVGYGYLWDFGDNSRPKRTIYDTISYNYPDTGLYKIMLIATDINTCVDTTYFNTRIVYIEAGFDIDTTYGCIPGFEVNVSDTSISEHSISYLKWIFNDGTVIEQTKDTSHYFTYSGQNTHYISLLAVDSLGCYDYATKSVHFSIPDGMFEYVTDLKICDGDSVGINPIGNNIDTFIWTFNGIDTTITTNEDVFYHVFNNSGTYQVQLNVIDNIGCIASYTNTIESIYVQAYPQAEFYTIPDFNEQFCYGEQVYFIDTSIVPEGFDYRIWDLGDGSPIIPNDTVGKNYNEKGTFTASLIEVTTNGCSDTVSYEINVVGPIADFKFSPDNICKGQSIDFNTFNMEDSYYLYIDYGDGIVDSVDVDGLTDKTITHQYNYSPPLGYTTASVTFYSENMKCSLTIDSIVHIYPVIADFKINNQTEDIDTLHCIGSQDVFYNNSTNFDYCQWDLGDGAIAMGINANHTYLQAGDYNVELNILHYLTGCADTISKTIHIKPQPEIQAFGGDTCVGAGITIYVNTPDTGLSCQWTPTTGLDSSDSQSTTASPDVSTEYTVVAVNQWNCKSTSSAYVNIQQEPENWIKDTTIIIGESLLMDGNQGNSFTYKWTPKDYLPCDTCPSPYFMPDDDIEYTLLIVDTMGCGFLSENIYTIEVLDVSSIDVPDVFTPNGDGDNDVIYVKGWGIKKLIEFSIYNRWGEKVFTTTDINKGWDGTYKGKKQNIDSYAYYVKAIVYIDDIPYEKKGTITLIR